MEGAAEAAGGAALTPDPILTTNTNTNTTRTLIEPESEPEQKRLVEAARADVWQTKARQGMMPTVTPPQPRCCVTRGSRALSRRAPQMAS